MPCLTKGRVSAPEADSIQSKCMCVTGKVSSHMGCYNFDSYINISFSITGTWANW